MRDEPFNEWLASERGYSDRAARDVVSRCRRIEKILGTSLDRSVRSATGRDTILERLRADADQYLRPGSNKTTAVGILLSAVRLYHDFLQALVGAR